MKRFGIGILKCMLVLSAGVYTMAAIGADDGMPATQQTGQVVYLSGGIGLDQSQAIKSAMHDYSLSLTFVGRTGNGNEYLSDIPVIITDSSGNTVLETASTGPYMLANLPRGRYMIQATYMGKTEQRTVYISPSQHARQVFSWVM